MRLLTAMACLGGLVACSGAQPRPAVFADLDVARQTAATHEAAQWAPQSFAEAEKHRAMAEEQYRAGHVASSQIAAERALAGYEQTQATARIARAERQLAEAEQTVQEHQKQLALIAAQLQQVGAEQVGLENQVKLNEGVEVESLATPTLAKPEREAARRETARALAAQARLLCVSARLLSAPAADLDPKLAQIDTLDEQLAKLQVPTPINVAIDLREQCLRQLVLVRRPKVSLNPQSTAGDQLFVRLSSAHLAPSRDERGVLVTFHDAFAANGIGPATQTALRQLKPILDDYRSTPVLIVVHSAHANAPRDEARGKAAAELLGELGATHATVQVVGERLPLISPHVAGAEQQNERLELVFVLEAT